MFFAESVIFAAGGLFLELFGTYLFASIPIGLLLIIYIVGPIALQCSTKVLDINTPIGSTIL